MSKNNSAAPKPGKRFRFLAFLGKLLYLLLETVLIAVILLYGVMFVVTKGPSETARNLFVMSVRETSAIGFLADLFFTPEEIAAIEASQVEEYVETDTTLVTITAPEGNPVEESGPTPDAWGFVDEDGDGIILDEIHGQGFSGYMMIVLDPSRVIVGCFPEKFDREAYSVAEHVEKFDATAGINAGGFVDIGGNGNGSSPDSLVVYKGVQYAAGYGTKHGFAGIDSNNILHVGRLTSEQVTALDIQYGVSFGPALIVNGEINTAATSVSGVNPRTAIGQRSDGAMLLMVIDGRQAISIGATYADEANIMLSYGAVNALNLDGGSSSLMYWNGEYVNNCASVVGIRDVPTTILVLKEGQHG